MTINLSRNTLYSIKEGDDSMSLINFLAEGDTDTHRICGTCGAKKPLDAFYKDGKDRHGKMRYRRDCKECYKKTRMMDMARKGATQDE